MIFIKSIVAVSLSISAAAAMYVYWPKSEAAIVSKIPSPAFTTPAAPAIPMTPIVPVQEPKTKAPTRTSSDSQDMPIGVAAAGTGALVLICIILESATNEKKNSI